MEVEDYIVYRIIPFEAEVKVGDPALPSKWNALEDYKKCIEETLERHRPDGLPRRDKCLYVCFSKENAYEWAYIKYGRQNTTYKLLTLDITGDLYWFMSDCYNFLGNKFTQERLDKACKDYWSSMTEDKGTLVLDKGYEGLFVGEAKVVAIEYKNYMSGESFDVE